MELRRYISANGIDNVSDHYSELKREGGAQFIFEESHLRRLGVLLHRENNPNAALAIFRLNVREHPKAFRAYDFLANAYFRTGDLERAEATFKQSLELNPGNPYALRKLKDVDKAMKDGD